MNTTPDAGDGRTETDERVAENAAPAARVAVSGDAAAADPATGLPAGTHEDDRSPLDRGAPLDPTKAAPGR